MRPSFPAFACAARHVHRGSSPVAWRGAAQTKGSAMLSWNGAAKKAKFVFWRRHERARWAKSPFCLCRGAQRRAGKGPRMSERSEFARTPPGASTAGCPAPRAGTQTVGVAFLLGTFLWRSKEKCLGRRAETRPATKAKTPHKKSNTNVFITPITPTLTAPNKPQSPAHPPAPRPACPRPAPSPRTAPSPSRKWRG